MGPESGMEKYCSNPEQGFGISYMCKTVTKEHITREQFSSKSTCRSKKINMLFPALLS